MRGRACGFALLSVALALAVVAAVAFLMNREGALQAEIAGREIEAAEVRYVAEAGLAHATWRLQRANCNGYTDLPATPFGAHSYSASVAPTSGSPVAIAATGTLASGVSRVLRDEAVPVYEPALTTTLQLGVDPGRDVLLDAWWNIRNYGGVPYLKVASDPSWTMRTLLDFDLSTIPHSVKVLWARLELYQQSVITAGAGASITVHRATRNWIEGTRFGGGQADGATWETYDGATPWATAGGEFAPEAVASAPIAQASDVWVSWEVGGLVADWLAGRAPNRGFLLQGQGMLSDAKFASREHTNAVLRPRLIVAYACECGSGGAYTWNLKPDAASGRDTYLNDGQPTTNFGSWDRIFVTEKINRSHHGLLHFDVSSLPAAATVTSAILTLDLVGISGGDVGTVYVHEGQRAWVEDQATWRDAQAGVSWTTAGGDFEPIPVASAAVDVLAPGPRNWDVTPLVASWAGGTPNHGLVLTASSGIDAARFASSDAAVAAVHPTLTVAYSCPCGVDCSPGCTPGSFADTFTNDSFANNDGSQAWSGDWIEVDEAGAGPTTGKAMVSGGVLSLRGTPSGAGPSLAREADLSAYGSASLSFEFTRGPGDDAGEDGVVLEVSGNGGASWTLLEDFTPELPGASAARSYDISAQIAANTQVRFRVTSNYGGSDESFQVDDLTIIASCAQGGGGGPPPGPAYPVEADATVFQGAPATNYGSDSTLEVGRASNGKDYAAALRFDLSALPAGVTVTGATLRLYQTGASGSGSIDVGAYKVNAAWDEASLTWDTLDDDATQLALQSVPLGTSDWSAWSLPPGLIHEWLDIANHGLVLQYQANFKGKIARFASKEESSPTLHPELLLEYTLP